MMPGRLTNKNKIKALLISLVSLYAFSRAFIIFLLDMIISNSGPGKIGTSYLADRKALYCLYYLMADLAPLFIIAILAAPIVKRIISDFKNQSSSNLSSIISDQQKELEKQNKLINNITNLYNDAVEYNRIKTEFFSNISHELKTPLSVILGAIQLIDQKNSLSAGDRNASKHFKTIRQNCYRLVRLINNMLDITRIDSGYIKMNLSNCNIVYLVEEIAQSIASFAEQKNICLEFDTEFEEIITAVDMDKIERIVLNLLSNAIKFTPSNGKISVNVKNMNDRVFISVKDTGPGIPACMHALIFDRFKQVNSTLTRESEGTGIGLSLVKSFVELHDGNISVVSEEGKGSEFIIELPVKQIEEAPSSDSKISHSQPRIIEAINIEFSDIYSIAS